MPDPAAAAFDVLIAGGGPIGSVIALALAGAPLRVGLIGPPATPDGDARPIALSHGSMQILDSLGCRMPTGASAITAIHVSHQGRFGRTLIRAEEHQLPALGYVVGYDEVSRTTSTNVGCARFNERVDAIEDRNRVAAAVTRSGALTARLIVLADGGHLTEAQNEHYGQVAVVGQISSDQPSGGRAWERFTPDGPLALLPFQGAISPGDAARDGAYAMVWCMAPARAAALAANSDEGFLAALQHSFGHRAGRFVAASTRTQFPLALRRAIQAPPRCVTVGNAAQALHPVAGQGLNLGLRDGVELARLIRDCAPQDLGSPEFVARFEAARTRDRNAGVRITDSLVRFFSNTNPLAGAARGAGLFMLDLMPAPRRFLARRMMFGMRAMP
jgi:2-octaprenyl-6-methoxyphenol hydroxylase